MSRQDKATEATLRMLQQPAPTSSAPVTPTRPEPEMVMVRKTVANSAARTMVYMPPAMKQKFKEIAYHERRKENDLCLEALRDWLAKKGHKVE
jgi:hypothetical protein